MIDVRIPKMGMSTVEVEVVEVLVQFGSHVSKGDILFEVEGDKSSFEVPSPTTGTVKEMLLAEGDTRQVGDIAVRIEPDA